MLGGDDEQRLHGRTGEHEHVSGRGVFRAIVEKWNNEKVGRAEIQTLLRTRAIRPSTVDRDIPELPVCHTHMFPDPSAGSGWLAKTQPARLDPTLRKAKSS